MLIELKTAGIGLVVNLAALVGTRNTAVFAMEGSMTGRRKFAPTDSVSRCTLEKYQKACGCCINVTAQNVFDLIICFSGLGRTTWLTCREKGEPHSHSTHILLQKALNKVLLNSQNWLLPNSDGCAPKEFLTTGWGSGLASAEQQYEKLF